MNEKEKAKKIIKILNKIYPKAPVPLKHRNTFTLLVSVLLSAQCTDVNVNNVTKDIYPKYNKPEHFVKLGRKKIEKLIKSIGIFRIKAKSIYLMSKQILEKHKGKVPKTFEEFNRVKSIGFSDKKISQLTDQKQSIVKLRRKGLKVTPVFKKVDTCAAEFKSFTPYMYSTYHRNFSF